MRPLARRMALVLAAMFWQGGFMFYGAVVVPVGTAELGSDAAQGFVTRRVTWYLNLAGLPALAAWAADIAAEPGPRRARWALWGLLAASLAAQFWLRARLDGLLDPAARLVLDRPLFQARHIAYLVLSTGQWALALALLALTLRAWSARPGA